MSKFLASLAELDDDDESSDQTTFKRGSVETRFIPLTIDIGQVTEVKIDFKKTGNLISSSWYSASWTFTKAVVLNGDQQDR
jgi:hypothetical protein